MEPEMHMLHMDAENDSSFRGARRSSHTELEQHTLPSMGEIGQNVPEKLIANELGTEECPFITSQADAVLEKLKRKTPEALDDSAEKIEDSYPTLIGSKFVVESNPNGYFVQYYPEDEIVLVELMFSTLNFSAMVDGRTPGGFYLMNLTTIFDIPVENCNLNFENVHVTVSYGDVGFKEDEARAILGATGGIMASISTGIFGTKSSVKYGVDNTMIPKLVKINEKLISTISL